MQELTVDELIDGWVALMDVSLDGFFFERMEQNQSQISAPT